MTDVLVVDDSQFMRTVLSTVLGEHGYDVDTASDGESAIEATLESEPDVITMDVEMPGMDGIEAVGEIMARRPTPILMLSAYTREGADQTLDALARGALEFIHKPSGEISADIGTLEDELVETVESLRDVDLDSVGWERAAAAAETPADAQRAVREATAAAAAARAGAGGRRATSDGPASAGSPRANADAGDGPATAGVDDLPGDGAVPAVRPESEPVAAPDPPSIDPDSTADVPEDLDASPTVVVGASTGGPRVIERVLSDLPAELGARVLVVQHMPASFTDRLARRVDAVTEYEVREAADGARVVDGEVLIAKGDYHMAVTYAGDEHCKVRLTEDEPVHGVRPAIDVTMETAAREVDGPLVGVALTGMGADGADGIGAIKDAGGATIAQDEATAPVHGIPRHAIETGNVDRVLPADEVAAGVVDATAEVVDGD